MRASPGVNRARGVLDDQRLIPHMLGRGSTMVQPGPSLTEQPKDSSALGDCLLSSHQTGHAIEIGLWTSLRRRAACPPEMAFGSDAASSSPHAGPLRIVRISR